ncbi:MAG: hypothetical protein KAR42_11050 [candidate division Zixibacteria bacterium]|nr:hypothetical protein [candidate division Zixibacteria bacterium]
MANDLEYIKEKVNNHDKLMHQLIVVAERQVSLNEKLNDHIVRTDKRMDKQDDRIDKNHDRIDKNHTMILKWSGAGAVIATMVGSFVSLTKLFPGLVA